MATTKPRRASRAARAKLAREVRAELSQYIRLDMAHVREGMPQWRTLQRDSLDRAVTGLLALLDADKEEGS